MALMRHFDTGATRNLDESKLDLEGFFSPLVMERFAQYMHENRIHADGSLRASDNWQLGIPKVAYMKSGYRHFFDWWKEHRGIRTDEGLETALCALLFNVQGYLHEHLKAKVADNYVVSYVEADDEPPLRAGEAYREAYDAHPGANPVSQATGD